MKKVILLIIILGSLSLGTKANLVDSIPNAGFEVWNIFSWFTNPRDWQTNNTSLLAATVEMDGNSYAGNYAMKLINSGSLIPEASTKFYMQEHPLTLTGYVRNEIINNDSAYVRVRLFQNGLQVDSGVQSFFGGINPNYHSFIIPLSQNSLMADSCEITIIGGQQITSSISFDELSFTSISSVSEKPAGLLVSVFPNPFRGKLNISLNSMVSGQINVQLFTMEGKSIIQLDDGGSKKLVLTKSRDMVSLAVDLDFVPPGVYQLIVSDEKKSYSEIILKE